VSPADPLSALCDDLGAEHAALDALVADLEASRWDAPTPAEGWTIRDQIAHLASYDVAARIAATDADGWAREAALSREARERRQLDAARRSPAELLAWWRESRRAMLEALRPLDRRARLPWYGPPMSALTFTTARLEETWGHGQDVADALGVRRADTDRLRHIAHLGVLTRGYSFTNQGHPAPSDDVRVELASPGGATWVWGDERAVNRVTGSARGFCLVVTRRRHVADTDLVAEGPVARAWLEIAQAFAGPPGSGRRPGQFSRD
jgi:uncharacterized protein (TIGR03084 family)